MQLSVLSQPKIPQNLAEIFHTITNNLEGFLNFKFIVPSQEKKYKKIQQNPFPWDSQEKGKRTGFWGEEKAEHHLGAFGR